ncbi:unnamed protein product [Mucor hiemalis]
MFLGKQEGLAFFSKAGIPNELLEEIWLSADRENKEYITETEFYVALKLIACAQNGIERNENILSTQVPLPQFASIAIAPKDIEPIAAAERGKYIEIFQSCNLVDGLLYGQEARSIFVRSGLPGVTLNAIWMLADTRGSGSLNKTEFIIAMHYLSRLMSDPTLTLPQTLPSQTYVEATGSFASSIRRNNIMTSPAISNKHIITTPLMSHMTASTTSLDDTVGSLHNSSINQVVLTESEVKKYEVYFNQLDTDNSGFIEADEAVYFFSHSRLPDSELGFIWEIADSRRIGKLDLHDFAVAMHLIGMRKNNQSIDHYTQQNTQNQFFPNLLDQHQNTDLLTQRYELESQLVEIKQQTISQQKLIDALAPQLEETKAAIFDLQSEISAAKNESMITRNEAEKAEKEVELLKQKRDRLSSHGMGSPSRAFISSLPELTRTSSTLSGSTVLSPRSEQNTVQSLFDPFNTIKSPATTTTTIKMPLSPIQAKAVSKYGFDITMFDTLTVSENNRHAPTSVNDDLATLFNPPATLTNDKKVASHNFDSVFM